jgi:hypothetical protein
MQDQIVNYIKTHPIQAGLAGFAFVVMLFVPHGFILRLVLLCLLVYLALKAGKDIDL